MIHWHIQAADTRNDAHIVATINNKTKPLGALGQLEILAFQLAQIQNSEKLQINRPTLILFAADHGIAAQGVSIAPSEVTTQMVANFLSGGAAINCFCRSNELELLIVDAGIKQPLEPKPTALIDQSVGRGTADFSEQPAMTQAQLESCLEQGAALVKERIALGCNVVAFGEMGIGNTSSASAILAALSDIDIVDCVGQGSGINDTQWLKKTDLVEKALSRFYSREPLEVLRQVGGFEIAQMVGAMLQAASERTTIVVDGFIVTVAALIAYELYPAVHDYMVFAHCSSELAHRQLLAILVAEPLLDLKLCLGEGTGAALAMPLLRAAVSFYNDMATFESAGVTV